MIFEKDFNYLCDYLGKDASRLRQVRIRNFMLGISLSILIYVFLRNAMGSILLLFTSVFWFKFEYWTLKSNYQKYISRRQLSFVSFLGFVLAFLENNFNVYQSLKESKNYADTLIEFDLRELIDGIDKDKTPQPYIQFAQKYQSETINQIMLLIFQLEQNGFDSALLSQFLTMMDHLRNSTVSNYVQEENQRLNWYYGFPLISTVILTTLFAFGVLGQVIKTLNG